MRILHYDRSFSELSKTFIYDYITELERHHVDNYVITENRKNQTERPFEKVHVVKPPGVFHPERLVRRIKTAFLRQEPRVAAWEVLSKRLATEFKKIKPDIIHAHFGPEGGKIAPVAERFGIPLIISFYGYDISQLVLDDFWLQLYKKLNKQVEMVTALSEQMKIKLIEVGFDPEKISVIHLSRDLSRYDFKKVSVPVRKFVSVGRLTAKKGHFDAVDAVKKVIDSGYDIELDIIGDGELKKKLEIYIRKKGMEESVNLLGSLPNHEVISKMKKADAFILCSKTGPNGDMEGTPTVLVEAQAMGLPCITTFHAGIPEMIPEENHFLLSEEGNVPEITKKIETLVSCTTDELEKITTKGREKVGRDFNIETEVEKLIRLYEKISEQK